MPGSLAVTNVCTVAPAAVCSVMVPAPAFTDSLKVMARFQSVGIVLLPGAGKKSIGVGDPGFGAGAGAGAAPAVVKL